MGNALRHVRGESQKNIVRFIEGLSGKYSRWDIWQDFIIMSAIAIANTMGGPQAKAREEMYRSRAEKYSAKELEVFADMLLEVVAELERDPEQDFLGELFMALGLGNEWKGQFFTPYSVCRAMSAMTYAPDMTARIEKQGWVSVNDPACGAGALLLAFANECWRQHINYQTSVLFVAQDIDFLAGCMCYIQLSLLGCPGYVVIDDSLLRPSVSYDARGLLPKDGPQVWYTPMYFRDVWHYRRIGAQMDLLFRNAAEQVPAGACRAAGTISTAGGNENRPAHSILMGGNGMRQPPPLGSRTWKPEEEDYLMEKWGQISVPAIAKKLNRTTNAVKVRAQRLGLGAVLMAGEYVTLNQLLLAVNGGSSSYGYKMKSWVENRGLPVHTKKVNRCSFRVVYIEEFWEWAERYRSFIDFSKMEPLALGEEPGWVAEQRKKDFEAYAIQRKDPWGEDEDSRLKMLLSKHRYSWAEISEMMHRSHGAIARRCRDLGIKDRPVSMELTGKRGTWTSEDFEILADGIRHGDSYAAIGKAVGRSEKCVRSKVYNDYLTENADKVREMLGDGAWGHGAPEMDVRHGFYISRTRHQVRRDLSALATVLRKRMNDLGYDPYWQRFMCMNWDDIGGCSAGCTDCDSCTAFRRIQPQYCARCGGTFYERKENRFCAACRTARKKQAQRHWCRVNGMSRK